MVDTLNETIPVPSAETLHPEHLPEVGPPLETRRSYEEACRLGQTIVALAREREEHGFTPYVTLEALPEDYRSAIASKDLQVPCTQEDVNRARRASLGLGIEATAQVSEATLRGPLVTEGIESLEHLHRTLGAGQELRQQTLKTNRADVLALTKEAVARRLGKPVEQVAMGDDELSTWLNEHYQAADARLTRGIEALKAYLDTSHL